MAKKVSSNEQEQHIVRNKNVWEDEIHNNKNKADFIIVNDQLNESNINKAESSKSFFRMNSTNR